MNYLIHILVIKNDQQIAVNLVSRHKALKPNVLAISNYNKVARFKEFCNIAMFHGEQLVVFWKPGQKEADAVVIDRVDYASQSPLFSHDYSDTIARAQRVHSAFLECLDERP